MLFGTNFPQLLIDKCADDARKLGLSDEIEVLFLRENARRVFDL